MPPRSKGRRRSGHAGRDARATKQVMQPGFVGPGAGVAGCPPRRGGLDSAETAAAIARAYSVGAGTSGPRLLGTGTSGASLAVLASSCISMKTRCRSNMMRD